MKIFSLIKSIYINISLFGVKKGCKVPVLISSNTSIKVGKGSIQLPDSVKFGMVKMGFGGSIAIEENRKNILHVSDEAILILEDNVCISKGFSIVLESDAKVKIWKNFYANKNFVLSSRNQVNIASDCLIGWNVHIRDSDGHRIFINNHKTSLKKHISIGGKVWIASNCFVLGNTEIGSNSVVTLGSILNKTFPDYSLIAGVPAKRIKYIDGWEK